ncbi:hypothetical protein Rs2_04879 [Raphanus sativus]|nr:hypothetical protein Rs2_04879 [Raphanus sativus]
MGRPLAALVAMGRAIASLPSESPTGDHSLLSPGRQQATSLPPSGSHAGDQALLSPGRKRATNSPPFELPAGNRDLLSPGRQRALLPPDRQQAIRTLPLRVARGRPTRLSSGR